MRRVDKLLDRLVTKKIIIGSGALAIIVVALVFVVERPANDVMSKLNGSNAGEISELAKANRQAIQAIDIPPPLLQQGILVLQQFQITKILRKRLLKLNPAPGLY